jgi:MFS transporter, DHA2 family, multidrug resistance protein
VLYSTIAILPMFLQILMGYSSMQSGLAVSPRGIGSFISMIIVGRIVSKVDARLLISIGFAMLAFSVYWLTGINLNIEQSNVVWPNVLNGLSMGFIFIPMSTMSLRTLLPEQMNNGTGISSLMRNLGGGIGISAATTMLARGAQAHQANLVQHMTVYDQPFQQRVQEFQSFMHAPLQQTYAYLYGTLLKQSLLLSFIDIFRVLAVVCLLCIPLTFLFKKPKA